MDSNFNVLPLFKSHYSLGKSILTLDEPKDKKGKPVANSIFNILNENKIDTAVLVDDNVSGILEASKNAKASKVKLVFGVRLWVTHDINEKNEEALRNRARYIVFTKNLAGYDNLIKIWTKAATDGFYYEPCIDFKNLKALWNDKNLKLAVPFYDSFLHANVLESHKHVPELDFTKPYFLIEDNSLPFDSIIQDKVKSFTKENKFTLVPSQSIYYEKPADFTAYLTRRCIQNRTDIERPNLDHMCSDEFCFTKWQRVNNL